MALLMKLIILPLLAAFSHWSYVITENYLIVVDLQGVDRENKYILTDPSIHSQDPQFGNTNLGKLVSSNSLKVINTVRSVQL